MAGIKKNDEKRKVIAKTSANVNAGLSAIKAQIPVKDNQIINKMRLITLVAFQNVLIFIPNSLFHHSHVFVAEDAL